MTKQRQHKDDSFFSDRKKSSTKIPIYLSGSHMAMVEHQCESCGSTVKKSQIHTCTVPGGEELWW